MRHVRIQPSTDATSSCLQWFTVDLYLDDQGQARVVSLDRWKP